MISFHVFFLSLILKESNAFTYQMCSRAGSPCYDQIFDGNSFQAETINTLYEQNSYYDSIWFDQADSTDTITINLDNINRDIAIQFRDNTLSSPITIQTNADEDTENFNYPTIYASGHDIYIENLNPKNDKSLFIYEKIECDKIYAKDNSKPLLIFNSMLNISQIGSNSVYLSGKYLNMEIREATIESKTIILTPYIRYAYDDVYYYGYIYLRTYLYLPTKAVYGENQIRFEFDNSNILTFITETQRIDFQICCHDDMTVSCDEGFNEYNLIAPYIEQEANDKIIKIEGNWPIVKTTYIEEEYTGDGKIIDSYNKYCKLTGTFEFSATNFPVYYMNHITLILPQSTSSIYFLDDEINSNMTLITNNEFETVFIIDGMSISTRIDKNSQYYNTHIIAESPYINIIANANREFSIIGSASIFYKKIDNRENKITEEMKFLKGGEIILPFGVDFDIYYDDGSIVKKFNDVYNDYKIVHPEPPSTTASSTWSDYSIDFVKDKINDLASIINGIKNNFFQPLTIDLIENNNFIQLNKKNTLTIIRTDLPFASVYSDVFDKQFPVLCVKEGTIDLSEWTVKLDKRVFRGFSDGSVKTDDLFNLLSPKLSDFSFTFSTLLTNDDKCIGIQPKSIPKSLFEVFIYTKDESYIELLEKIEAVKVLTPDDLDISSKLINKNTRNFLVIILDDLPEGKTINMNGISRNANVIVVGYKIEFIDKIFDVILQKNNLDSVGFAKVINDFASQFPTYRPSVSITYTNVQTFFVILVNYLGTHIRCTNFWPILSTFPNLVQNPNDFSAQNTLTEIMTYPSIENLKITDLIIFPIAYNPLNMLTVLQVNFTEKEWNFKFTEFVKEEGYMKDEDTYLTISYEKVRGQLFLYTFDYWCNFTIPEVIGDNPKIKGISLNTFSILQPKISDIHGMFTLEDNDDSENGNEETFSLLNLFSKLSQKVKNLLEYENEDEEETESNSHFVFTGDWDKVTSIDGVIEINTAEMPAIIDDVPTVVAESLNVKSDKNVQITSMNEKMVFTKPQVISQPKTISFQNKNTEVTFSNLTFNGDVPSLSLIIDGNPSKVVTDHILIESETYAQVMSDIEVKESFEFGPESSLKANLISPKTVKLTMNYRLRQKFGNIPDSIQPETIVLNYIGENENLDDVDTDYSIFLGALNDIQKFNENDHKGKCDSWKSKTSLKSDFFPEFREDSKVVEVVCINQESSSILALNLTTIPEGEIILPSETDDYYEPIFPGDEETLEPSNEIDDTGGNGGKEKKKISFFAVCGIIIGCVVLVVIIIVIVVVYNHSKSKDSDKSENENENEEKVEDLPKIEKDVPLIDNKKDKVQPNLDEDESDIDFWIYP